MCREQGRRGFPVAVRGDGGGEELQDVAPLAPARGERFTFRATVVKSGRTLTVCEARAFAEQDGAETLVATMTGTLMALTRRGPASPSDGN